MKRSIQSVTRFLILLVVQLLALQAAATSTTAGRPPKPEKGKGWYVMVLWEPGTPIPGSDSARHMKNVTEPDIGKLGGKVLSSKDNQRFIELPVAAARVLRQHGSVAILQRLWAGEPLEELKEEPSPGHSRSGLEAEADTNLDWGPKDYTYDGSGNIKTIGPAVGPDSYFYDTAGRLMQATVGGKTETFKYDAFGNLVEKAVAGANPEVVPVDGSSNRMIGASYDAAGNVTTRKGADAYQYDSFNMLTVLPSGRYNLYDANDERVGLIDDNLSRWWLRDLEGRLIREYTSMTTTNPVFDPPWLWQQDYVHAGGQLVGGEKVQWSYSEPGGGTSYGGKRHYHLDHLGNVRVVTDDDGRSVSEHDYYAFGVTPTKAFQEELGPSSVTIDSMRYAGHQREFLGLHNIENRDYLDYMHARFYDPNLGRFLSVDPVIEIDKALKQPQRWNRYSYVLNNPVRYTDPTGKVVFGAVGVAEEIRDRKLAQQQAQLAAYAQQLAKAVQSGGLDSKLAVNLYWNRAVNLTAPKTAAGAKPTTEAVARGKENALLVATGAALSSTVRGSVGNTITRGSMGADTLHHFFINAVNTFDGMPVRMQQFGANDLRGENDARDIKANNAGAVFGDVLQRDPNAQPSSAID